MLAANPVMEHIKSDSWAGVSLLGCTSVCDKCAVPFDPQRSYAEHLTHCPATDVKQHTKHLQNSFIAGKPFPCIACPLERLKKKELWKSELRTEECLVCTNKFEVDSGLHLHKTEEGRMICGVCTFILDDSKVLEHVLKHLVIRSCFLRTCSVECAVKHTFHSKSKKTDKQRLFCPVCFTGQFKLSHCRQHMEKHFDSVYPCDICKRTFKTYMNIRLHLKKHHRTQFDRRGLIFQKAEPLVVLTCDHCCANFPGKEHLIEHINENHFLIEVPEPKRRLENIETALSSTCYDQENYSNLKFLYPPHFVKSKRCPAHRRKIKEYYSSTFQEGVSFPGPDISAKRRVDLEIVPRLTKPIPCGNCKKNFLPDNTLPIYELDSKTVMCGYCSDSVPMRYLSWHQYEHIFSRSFLFDICSRACLLSLITASPEASLKKFKCVVCFRQFVEANAWRHHHANHLPESVWNYVCQKCGLRFPSEKKLNVHKTNHTTSFPCPFCLVGLTARRGLDTHIQYAHPAVSKIPCLACEKTFDKTDDYAEHLPSCQQSYPKAYRIDEEFSVDCIYCKSSFPDISSANDHRKVCVSVVRCYHCNFTSHLKRIVRSHIEKIHLGVVKFVTCSLCNRRFKKAYIHSHMNRVHSKQGKKEAVCEVCGMKFSSDASLYMHVTSKHKKPNRFKCDQCSKSFGLKHHLKQHVFYNHSTDFPFHCEKCGNRFRRESNLKEHIVKTCKKR